MTVAASIAALSARLSRALSELERGEPGARPADLTTLEDEIAQLCRDLSDLPADQRAAALDLLEGPIRQLSEIETSTQRRLDELSRRLGAVAPGSAGGGPSVGGR